VETAEAESQLWKRHEFLDGLYRFYLDKIISFHSFYLPIAGGVAAYVLAHPSRASALGLVVPLIVSVGAAFIFCFARKEAGELKDAIVESAKALNILASHAQILVRAANAFFILHLVVASGLVIGIVLLWDPNTRAWLSSTANCPAHAVDATTMRAGA
jgi:hypothetical protein